MGIIILFLVLSTILSLTSKDGSKKKGNDDFPDLNNVDHLEAMEDMFGDDDE